MTEKTAGLKRITHQFEGLLAAGVVLIISALTYLPLVPQLGYYHDDWFTVASRISGISLAQMHSIDRPLMGQLYDLTYALLGDIPLAWHLSAFMVRTAGCLLFLWLLRMLWKHQTALTTSIAVLFTVYPGFLIQPSANNYLNHLISLCLGILSLAFTLRSLLEKHLLWKIILMVPAALLVLVYPRIYETMIGLETMRLLLICIVLARQENGSDLKTIKKRLMYTFSLARRLLLQWLPYLLAMAVFFYWRFVRFKSVRTATNAQALFDHYRRHPLAAAWQMITSTIIDVFETTLSAWFVPLSQRIARAGLEDVLLSLLLAAAASFLFWRYLSAFSKKEQGACQPRLTTVLGLGVLLVLLTLLPVTAARRDVQFRYNLDRYTLQSMMGAAIAAGAVALIQRRRLQTALLLLLVSSGIVTHYHNAAYFRDFWHYQRSFWWQLSWRAPDLKKDTALVAVLPPGYRLAEGFEIWAPANLIYSGKSGAPSIQGEILDQGTAVQIANAEQIDKDFRTIQFTLDFSNTLIASLPGGGACLHLHDSRLVEPSAYEDVLVLENASYSHIERVVTDSQFHAPPAYLFGIEPQHDWCYYYQKASLARQQEDWDEVVRLADEAARLGLQAVDSSEWLPFLQGYAERQRVDEVQQISRLLQQQYTLLPQYCEMLQQRADDGMQTDSVLHHLCSTP